MNRTFSFAFLAFCIGLLFPSNVNGQDVSKLITQLLGESPIEEDLQELCDVIGGRVTGSTANEASVDWALKKFEEAGVKVVKEAFEMPSLWLEKSTTAHIYGAVDFSTTVVAKGWSSPQKISGQLIAIGKGQKEDFERVEMDLAGKIILVETELCLDINGLFTEYTNAYQTEILARARNVRAVVFMASRPRGLLYRFITYKGVNNELPQIVMAREDAKRCIRNLGNGETLSIEINIDAEVGGSYTAYNIIAEIPGSEHPEEVVVVGAHLDSWALGTGANDNGCNVSLVIDLARQMKELKIRPKRTIRFALWNGEEQGFFGSWAYTQKYVNTLDNHVMAMSIDIGSGSITGFFTNGRAEMIDLTNDFLQPVQALGTFTNLNIPIVGTDNFDFMLQGVPNLVANHKPASYGLNYHASSDTYDKVDLKSLKRNSAVIAAVVMGYANTPTKLRRHDRAEIQEMIDQTGLEFSMKMFNVWDTWINGDRGR